MAEFSKSDILQTVYSFLSVMQQNTYPVDRVAIGDIHLGYAGWLFHIIEAFLYDTCQVEKTVLRRLFPYTNVEQPKKIKETIFREDFENAVCSIHRDGIANKKINPTYPNGAKTLNIWQWTIIITLIVKDYIETGKLQDKYDIDFTVTGKYSSELNFETPTIKPVTPKPATPAPKTIPQKVAEVGALIKNYKYIRYRYHTAATLRKYGNGDCWSMAAFLCQELKKRGVNARRRSGVTAYSNAHRWCEYYYNGKWYPFPVSKYNKYSYWYYTSKVSNVYTMSGCGD